MVGYFHAFKGSTVAVFNYRAYSGSTAIRSAWTNHLNDITSLMALRRLSIGGNLDFDLTQEQQLFADTTRRFLADESDLAAVRELAESDVGFDAAWWQRAAELGWISLMVDESAGGLGLGSQGILYVGVVAEEVGRALAPGPLLPCSVVAATLSRSGNASQRSEVLPALVAGEATASWCFAEGGRSWSADAVQLEAKREGSSYRLRGVKAPVEAAGQAQHLLVSARCDGELTQFLVPADAEGVTIEALEGLDLARRFARVRFDDVQADEDSLVGSPGSAEQDIEQQLQLALAISCSESAGAVARVFDFTLEWVFDRYSFGRPLASYQALKHRFADMKTYLEGCHASVSAALHAMADGSAEAAMLVRVAKAFVGERAPAIVQECVQMHGGIGVTWEHDIHLYLRRVASNRVTFGEPREHRASIAGRLGI